MKNGGIKMSELFNPCYEHCYLRHGKEYGPGCDDTCEYAKAVKENREMREELDELKYPTTTLKGVALQFCIATECQHCPVHIFKYEKRTEEEKKLGVPCENNLLKWITEQVHLADKKEEGE